MEHGDVTVRPVTPTIGAEIEGVDLCQPLPSETVGVLRKALLEHLVLFFRNQPMTPEEHLRFAGYFGPVMAGHAARKGDVLPGMSVLDQVAGGEGIEVWHSDHMCMPETPMGTVLRAVQLPSSGGDTCFASMYAAYEALTPAMRAFLDPLTAMNSAEPVVARMGSLSAYREDITKDLHPPVAHPVVRVHPETGRKALWVSYNFTTRIVELSDGESNAVLSYLFEHVKSPMWQCRFRWEPGSVAFWDNRAVQHCGVPDYHERRVMNRTMIAGDRPFGPATLPG